PRTRSASEAGPRTTGTIVQRVGPALLAEPDELHSCTSRCARANICGTDAAARDSGPRFIGKPGLRRMCSNHYRDAEPDGWSVAGNSRDDRGNAPLSRHEIAGASMV